MSLEEILKQLPIADIAKQLDVDKSTAEAAVGLALPALLGGMQANAQDDKGAASLAKALNDHKSTTKKKVNVKDVDTKDGQKIVKNIFGGNTDAVVDKLGAVAEPAGGGIGDLIGKVLPILAPIVLTYLGTQLFSGKKEEEVQAQPSNAIGDLLGGLLGGGGNQQSSGGGDLLGNLVGGLFGGGNQQSQQKSSDNGLGDLVGGLLNNGGGDLLGNVLGGLLGGGKK